MARGFAIVKRYEGAGLNLPKRSTQAAAGYDFEVAEDFVVPAMWKLNAVKRLASLLSTDVPADIDAADAAFKPVLVPTGIKAYMEPNEFLMLANRSSNPLKRRLVLPNGVGVIDADYVDNPTNEGEIFIQLVNYGFRDVHLKKGERIAQGIFMPFQITDSDGADAKSTREAGFGSTGVK